MNLFDVYTVFPINIIKGKVVMSMCITKSEVDCFVGKLVGCLNKIR